ncbi:hypothetical protein SPURM210S_08440 [Streptomyces purpurascens]
MRSGAMLLHTSFVPKCMTTMSGRAAASLPGSRFWSATFVTNSPPWPSLSPSCACPQPCVGSVPTKSMSLYPLFTSRFHNTARQQPGEPVIESPSGMTRTGSAAGAAVARGATVRPRGRSRVARRPRTVTIRKCGDERRVLRMVVPSLGEVGALP